MAGGPFDVEDKTFPPEGTAKTLKLIDIVFLLAQHVLKNDIPGTPGSVSAKAKLSDGNAYTFQSGHAFLSLST